MLLPYTDAITPTDDKTESNISHSSSYLTMSNHEYDRPTINFVFVYYYTNCLL